MIERWQKRPVVIEAIQWDGSIESQQEIVNWTGGAVTGWFSNRPLLRVGTLEGDVVAEVGDYIVKGVQGEFYPVKPDIFHATYEWVGSLHDVGPYGLN